MPGTQALSIGSSSSMEVHWVNVMEYDSDLYIVFSFSDMNGFGGYNRETIFFKFEKGHISLQGDSSDYSAYENHKNEFETIKRLNVKDVMKMVN